MAFLAATTVTPWMETTSPQSNTPISWAELSQFVPKLTGTSNYDIWATTLKSFALSKGVLQNIVGLNAEPYRCKIDGKPLLGGELAGTAPPTGLQIDRGTLRTIIEPLATQNNQQITADQWRALATCPEHPPQDNFLSYVDAHVRLDAERTKAWNAWARLEAAARGIVLQSMEYSVGLNFVSLASAEEIFNTATSYYRVANTRRAGALRAELLAIYMRGSPTADTYAGHIAELQRIFLALDNAGSPIPSQERGDLVLSTISAEDNYILSGQWAYAANKSWPAFLTMYNSFVEKRRTDEIRNGGAAAATINVSRNNYNNNNGRPGKQRGPRQKPQPGKKDRIESPLAPSDKPCPIHGGGHTWAQCKARIQLESQRTKPSPQGSGSRHRNGNGASAAAMPTATITDIEEASTWYTGYSANLAAAATVTPAKTGRAAVLRTHLQPRCTSLSPP